MLMRTKAKEQEGGRPQAEERLIYHPPDIQRWAGPGLSPPPATPAHLRGGGERIQGSAKYNLVRFSGVSSIF